MSYVAAAWLGYAKVCGVAREISQMLRRGVVLFSVGATLVLGACGISPSEPQLSQQLSQQPGSDSLAQAPTNASRYLLHRSDRVRIKVYNEPEISGEYQVDDSGYLSVPLAGRLRAEGLTTIQLEREVKSRLSGGLLRDPRVNVEMVTYSPFYIHGEVKNAGAFPYRPGLTALDAVASAGGFTYRADESKVYVRRAGTSREEAHSLQARIPIYPGDNVRIPERFF